MFNIGDEIRLTNRKDFEGSSAIVMAYANGFYSVEHRNVANLREWAHLQGKQTHGWRASQLELLFTAPDETEAFFV